MSVMTPSQLRVEVDRLRTQQKELISALRIARDGLRWGCTDQNSSMAIGIIDAALAAANGGSAAAAT